MLKGIQSKGFSAFKMRVGAQKWENDIERVASARKALGQDELMIDAIMGTLKPAWDAQTALERIEDLSQFTPYWVEEPMDPINFLGYKNVTSKTNVSIAMGESFSGLHELIAYMENGCMNIVQPDVSHSGGYTQTIKVIEHASSLGMPVALHVWGSALSIMANLHLACACNIQWLEIPQVRLELLSEVIDSTIQIHEGYAIAPNVIGLGVSISEFVKNKYPFVPGSGYQVPSSKKS